MNKSEVKKGIAAVSLGSIFLGSVGVFVRLASTSIRPMMQSFGRVFLSFLLISLLNSVRRKIKTETLAIRKKHFFYFILNGLIGFSLMGSAFTLSVLKTSITNTYFLLYTAPVFAVILSTIFLKEKVTKPILISILISLLGLVFLFNPSNLTQNFLGNLLGLLTGICLGSYFVITGYLGKNYTSSTITFWTQLFGSLGLFPLIFIFDKPTTLNFALADWLPIFSAGTVIFIGYCLLNFGLRKIKASVGSIFSLFEPLSSIAYGLIFFSEKPSYNTLLGAGLIIFSIIYLASHQTKKGLMQ